MPVNGSTTLDLLKIPDKQILDCFVKLNSAGKLRSQNMLNISFGFSTIDVPIQQIDSNENLERAINDRSKSIQSISLQHRRYSGVRFTRDDSKLHLTFSPDDRIEDPEALDILAATNEIFPTYDPTQLFEKETNEYINEFRRQRESELIELRELAATIAKETSAVRSQLEDDYSKKRQESKEEYDQLKRTLETQTEEREKTLQRREEKLEERSKTLDDQESKHARRELQRQLKEQLQDRNTTFELTQGTRRLRLPIKLTTYCIGAVLTSVLVFSFVEATPVFINGNIGVDNLSLLLRILLSTAGLITLLSFYIRWENKWFEQHAQEEFRLKSLDLDIDRAAWVVEMALEWKDEKGHEIPQHLLEPMMRGLFTTERQGETTNDKVTVADLVLGTASSAKVKIPGGGEVEYDRKALKKLSDNKGKVA